MSIRCLTGTLGDVESVRQPGERHSPAYNVIYGMPLNYQPGRTVMLGARFQF